MRDSTRLLCTLMYVLMATTVADRMTTTAFAQPSSDGYDWVTIGAPGNAPWTGFSDPISPTYGRGGVNYEFRIGRTEVTTVQWVEFYNAALARPDPLPFAGMRWWGTPIHWGAEVDPNYNGAGVRFRVRTDIADAGMLPVNGISWRTAAVLCNWLENDKSVAPSAFMSGAYDVSTFTPEISFPTFNDQRQHTPGARYWIPTLDEYLKAAFYDPHHGGQGVGGWWTQPNGSDTPLVYGPPPSFGGDGSGQANAGFTLPGSAHLLIPLGAYPTVQSPWGLLDLAGGTREWLEEFWVSEDNQYFRVVDGSRRGGSGGYIDTLYSYGQDSPWVRSTLSGVRLASVIPTPGGCCILIAGSCVLLGQRSRKGMTWIRRTPSSSPS